MMISIVGKPSAGKSTLMVNLACAMAKKGITTAILSSDISYPSVQYYLGDTKIEKCRSLKFMFETEDADNARKYFIQTPEYKNIFVAGISEGEGGFEYINYKSEHIKLFINKSRNLFDCIIIENTQMNKDNFTAISIIESDIIIDIVNLSIQGIAYELAYEQFLLTVSKNKFLYRVLAHCKSSKNVSDIQKILGFRFDFQTPHYSGAEECINTGIPIFCNMSAGSEKYNKFINKIRKRIEKDMSVK